MGRVPDGWYNALRRGSGLPRGVVGPHFVRFACWPGPSRLSRASNYLAPE
jgi:hypothetical protein